jgi:(R)-citramalate synthase
MNSSIEILDVTLRDGEQTHGVVFSAEEKLNITKFLLLNLKVNRVEVASARVSEGEKLAVKKILEWAEKENLSQKIEILGFVDGNKTVDWALETNAKVINLLTKGSENHLVNQLKKTQDEHLFDISKMIEYAIKKQITVNVYLEDWSNGFLNSKKYMENISIAISKLPIQKLFLPDTLGVLSPDETFEAVSFMRSILPNTVLEFHGHNDYSLAVANCLSAVKAGIDGLHVSVNGLGERAGNSPLEAVITALHDKLNLKTSVVESEITNICKLVEIFSGKRISDNRPIVGQDVFTQTAGIHADGDKKGNLYANLLLPERFGRKRIYSLGKLAGKASISENLKQMGLVLSIELEKKILARVIELGDNGIIVSPEDLPFLIADLSGEDILDTFKILSCEVLSGKGIKPFAKLNIQFKKKSFYAEGTGDGGYDAFMSALKEIAKLNNFEIPELLDYQVRIPPGGKTSALVETIITWSGSSLRLQTDSFRTIGFDSDQTTAAIMATEKMLNLVLK